MCPKPKSGRRPMNEKKGNGNLHSYPSLEDVRRAWSELDHDEIGPSSDDVIQEIEEYLRSAVFQVSAIAHSLRASDITDKNERWNATGEHLEMYLRMCERASLFLVGECRSRQK